MKKDFSKGIYLLVAVMFVAVTFKMGQTFRQGELINKENVIAPQAAITKTYTFRNQDLKDEHFEKHGKYMGFKNADEYELAANDVINNKNALKKEETDQEAGNYVFYIEDTNEIVFLSSDGYIRTYFNPDSGKAYFDKQ